MIKKCIVYFKWTILLYVLMGFLVQFFNTLGIKIFQELLDKVVLADNFYDVSPHIFLYSALLVGATILNYLIEYPHTYLSNSILEKLKVMALSKVSKIDYSTYQNIGTGEMIKVIENGASAGMNIIHSFYLKTFHELFPTIIFSLFFISLYNTKIMLIIAAGYVVIFFLNNLLLRMLYRIKSSLLESQEKMSKYSIRGFMELVIFRLNKRYQKEIERLHNTAGDIVKKSTQIRMIHESFFAIFALLVNIIKVVVLVYGVKSILSGESSVGVIIALIMFIDQVYTPVAIFNVLYVDYKLNRVTYTRLEEFLNAPEDLNLDKGREVKTLEGNIEFKNVTFDYGSSKLLSNVSFSVKQGSSVAIVGLSGSGKSTIIKLMLGLLKKKSGKILFDGIDIDEIKLNSLYDHISYISQEAPIFDTTIRGNIVFDNDLLDERIYDILEKVRMKEKVLSFPEQLDTMVGERGMKLSGGERQRLAFGRIIAQQRNVVILDEPVSALDNITEKIIMNGILQMFSDKTLIIIAHRLHFIKDVDKILLVKDGEIVDEGDFEYLIRNSGYFQELWNKDIQNETEPSRPC
ncbi:ABC transporter ATP-binding protein [Paenibacillus terrigena]|uniref:ABC transporter ATP-binding protein n=1 Tax=Paenibacillus terrigena TaxID=369333 RepID=UPI00035F2F1D|nr:ABC transporter ATP-binding protein [Paenibacillus terrigena]